ncbi:hypothetical protein ACFSTC_26285 [Nonomuraea ferruginea]
MRPSGVESFADRARGDTPPSGCCWSFPRRTRSWTPWRVMPSIAPATAYGTRSAEGWPTRRAIARPRGVRHHSSGGSKAASPG